MTRMMSGIRITRREKPKPGGIWLCPEGGTVSDQRSTPLYLVYVVGRPYMNRKYYARSNALELVQAYKHKGWDARLKPLLPAWDDGDYNDWGIRN